MKRFYLGVAGAMALAVGSLTCSAGPSASRKDVEASMVLTGDIVVAPDGSVMTAKLDRADKVPTAVAQLVQAATSGWKFVPVMQDGQAVTAKARMSLRVVAKYDTPDSDHLSARVTGATFGDEYVASEERVAAVERTPPHYPMDAARARIQGTVYLAMRVDHDGHVLDAAAEQVNLRAAGPRPVMASWRKLLADSACHAARQWTYKAPKTGTHAADSYYVVRSSIDYSLTELKPGDDFKQSAQEDHYGQWETYIPGPKENVSWAKDDQPVNDSTDALSNDDVRIAGAGLKLTTVLKQG